MFVNNCCCGLLCCQYTT